MIRASQYANAAKVERPKGSALWALLMLGGGWIGVRLIIGGPDAPFVYSEKNFSGYASTRLITETPPSHGSIVAVSTSASARSPKVQHQRNMRPTFYASAKSAFWTRDRRIGGGGQLISASNLTRIEPIPLGEIERAYAGQIGPLFLFAAADERDESVQEWPMTAPDTTQSAPQRFSLYAYLFYRPGVGDTAPFAFYGGSQMYARADWRPFGGPLGGRTSLYARASRDLSSDGQGESAVGVSVAPLAAFPVTLHAERRFRPRQSDATAAFVSTGGAAGGLPVNARLDWDGQAGYLAPDHGEGTPFFDGQARLTAPVATASDWSLRGGAMAATGGQKGAARLDIGPVVTLQNGAMQGQVGWRFRVAGEAQPKSGPAVTISIGF